MVPPLPAFFIIPIYPPATINPDSYNPPPILAKYRNLDRYGNGVVSDFDTTPLR